MGIQINGQTDTISAIDGGITVATDLTVPGVLSYDDVTSIDSVGVITARSGIKVTGGSVGIGTDNPARKVEIVDTAATVLQLNSTSSDGTSLRILHSGTDKMYMGLAGDFIVGQANNVTDSAVRASGALLFASGGGTERLRIDSSGRVLIGTNLSAYKVCIADNTNAALVSQLVNTNTGSSTKSILQIQTGSNKYVNFENDYTGAYIHVVGSGIGTYYSSFDTHSFRNNAGTERLRITPTGALNVANPSNTVAAGLLNVPNGSRVTTSSGAYVTGNGGVVDMARYEMINKCITAFPANNTAICAINGAPLYINDARTTWAHYSNLPNYLLGTLTHDCINNSSFTVTLACTMTVFLGRDNGWNSVPLTGWTLIESGTSIGPFSGNTRLYVKTLAAGTHTLDNDSAMYFFSM